MYGNEPSLWREELEGWDRLRFTINAFTRLRVCDVADGRMRLEFKGPPATAPRDSRPGSGSPGAARPGERLVFGHWSALGYVEESGVLGLDTGCVWGGTLTGTAHRRRAQRAAARAEPLRWLAAGRLKAAREHPATRHDASDAPCSSAATRAGPATVAAGRNWSRIVTSWPAWYGLVTCAWNPASRARVRSSSRA